MSDNICAPAGLPEINDNGVGVGGKGTDNNQNPVVSTTEVSINNANGIDNNGGNRTEEEEEFMSADIFADALNPLDWDALINRGSKNSQQAISKWERDSLYVKFDPLVGSSSNKRESFTFKAPKPPGPPKVNNSSALSMLSEEDSFVTAWEGLSMARGLSEEDLSKSCLAPDKNGNGSPPEPKNQDEPSETDCRSSTIPAVVKDNGSGDNSGPIITTLPNTDELSSNLSTTNTLESKSEGDVTPCVENAVPQQASSEVSVSVVDNTNNSKTKEEISFAAGEDTPAAQNASEPETDGDGTNHNNSNAEISFSFLDKFSNMHLNDAQTDINTNNTDGSPTETSGVVTNESLNASGTTPISMKIDGNTSSQEINTTIVYNSPASAGNDDAPINGNNSKQEVNTSFVGKSPGRNCDEDIMMECDTSHGGEPELVMNISVADESPKQVQTEQKDLMNETSSHGSSFVEEKSSGTTNQSSSFVEEKSSCTIKSSSFVEEKSSCTIKSSSFVEEKSNPTTNTNLKRKSEGIHTVKRKSESASLTGRKSETLKPVVAVEHFADPSLIKEIAKLKETLAPLQAESEMMKKRNSEAISEKEKEMEKVARELSTEIETGEKLKETLENTQKQIEEIETDVRVAEDCFAELHMLYEGMKNAQSSIERNLEVLKKRGLILEEILTLRERREKATDDELVRLQGLMQQDFTQKLKEKEAENKKFVALARMSEMKIAKLESEIAQVDKENNKLQHFCRELVQH